MREKCQITQAKNPECSRRQVRNHAGQKHSGHPGCTGRQVETSLKSCGQRIQCVMGEKKGTSVKLWGPKHSEHPECTGRQVGDKPENTRAENPECSGRQDKWKISLKSCRQNPHCSGGQLEDKWTSVGQVRNHAGQSTQRVGDKNRETSAKSWDQSTQSIQSALGDKWETSLKIRAQRTQSVAGDRTSGR